MLASWKELGIDAKEVPYVRRTKTGMTSGDTTYGGWLKDQSEAVQKRVLGKKRAELFRSGKVDIRRFTNNRNEVLTLDQLAKREGISL